MISKKDSFFQVLLTILIVFIIFFLSSCSNNSIIKAFKVKNPGCEILSIDADDGYYVAKVQCPFEEPKFVRIRENNSW